MLRGKIKVNDDHRGFFDPFVAQALINKWEDVRVGASQRSERLREKFEKAELLLTDVNLALGEFLSEF